MNAASERIDLFSAVHDGIRTVLFQTALELQRTDLLAGSAEDLGRAEAALRRCLGRLRAQTDHEDRAIQPWVARSSPALAAVLAGEHVALEKAALAVEGLLPRLRAATPGERRAMEAELRRRFHRLVADQLLHLDREERDGNAALWAHLTEAQLLHIRAAAEIARGAADAPGDVSPTR